MVILIFVRGCKNTGYSKAHLKSTTMSFFSHHFTPTTVGFSTGALTKGDVSLALSWMSSWDTSSSSCLHAVELSALRESELMPLVQAIPELMPRIRRFSYISVHAPSHYAPEHEREVAQQLHFFTGLGWPIVVHPDAIYDAGVWSDFGEFLLIENMDKRKPVGRTAGELRRVFSRLPHAGLCFDVGHAQQNDPTMSQAQCILQEFGDRVKQLHLSAVDGFSAHWPLNSSILRALNRIARWLSPDVPVILETPVSASGMLDQVRLLCNNPGHDSNWTREEAEVFAGSTRFSNF